MSAPAPRPRLTLAQRAALAVVPPIAAAAIALLGATLRFENVPEDGAVVEAPGCGGIFCFWHQCTLVAGWRFRAYRPYVLISQSFDGELIARTLGLLGYRTVRGSSSRGAVGGLLALRQVVERGEPAIFTADGPRGPVFVAKAGPVKLAQVTGVAIGSFHLEPERAWVLGSWDRFLIPKPFSRVAVAWSRKVPPAAGASSAAQLEQTRQAVDAAVNRARQAARGHLGKGN